MAKIVLAIIIMLAAGLPGRASAAVPVDALVKASGPTVYYYAADGKRYVFPDAKTYASWFVDFSGIFTISDAELAAMPLGGNVTHRPGVRMVKIQTDPRVYAVARGGVLRWVGSEALAEGLYGQFWNTAIDDVSDAYFADYEMGIPIGAPEDFSPLVIAEATDTINSDLGVAAGPAPRRSDTEVSNIVDGWRAFALEHINRLRESAGKGPLVMNLLMNRIATIHTRDMALYAKNLQHEGSLGETPDERIREGKVPDPTATSFITVPHPLDFGWSGENIGYTTLWNLDDSPTNGIAYLHEAFMDEPPDQPNHRTTMLSTLHPYDQVGIGPYVDATGKLWLTEDYISP
ncbi:MAG TPA: CAP domain-containing protein [Candidatus Baltobacteraceae bacterium]|nr:CAP domain-containing protein [Candidatus Baltobacteraceae bacterium]